ncbi:DNA methylase [Paraglaciecola chathamensis S18K6]|uniref:Methyltransferase n=2 Tax=Paraglaciecola chathamensis TaxID=368405 RepID=A0AAV3V4N9_9ALTE|nr:DNA methylase [Paraglaciecola chathamensis S18K6]
MKSRGSGVHRLRENHFSICDWDNVDEDVWEQHMLELAEELFEKVKTGGAVVVFMAIIKVQTLKKIFEKAGFYYKTTGIWHKKNPMPRNMNLTFINSTESWLYFTKGKPSGTFNNDGKAIHDYFETGLTPKSEKAFGKHPTQKPLKLMSHLVSLLSNKGDVVCDPFCGSGTSLLAAKNLGRNYVGFDLNEEYLSITQKRLG